MADIRTLKLNLLADTANFKKGLSGAQKATNTFAGRIGFNLSRVEAAWLSIIGIVWKFKDATQGAIEAAQEDEASQKKLAKALQNTTKATEGQIASTETWIAKTQRAYGVADDKLRPALGKLAGYTGDLSKAQELLTIALNASAGTGKDLETVATAIGKAYDGQYGALKKLGVPLDDNLVKQKDTAAILQMVSDMYAGQASVAAETYAGKIAILNTSFGEFREKIGTKLIDGITKILPYIQQFVDELAGTGPKSLAGAMSATAREAAGDTPGQNLAQSLSSVATAMSRLVDAMIGSKNADAPGRINAVADALSNLANGINTVADAWKRAKTIWDNLPRAVKDSFNPVGKFTEFYRQSDIPDILGMRASGGPVRANGAYLVGERGPELFTPRSAGTITPNGAMGGVTIVMNGIVDGESARRSIERVIQQSARRSGAVNWSPVLT